MNIAIIGCGYIGYEIAKELYEKGHFVTCATRNPDSIKKLSKVTQKSIVMAGTDEKEISLLIGGNDVIIVTISTKAKIDFEESFLKTSQTIKKCAFELNTPKTIIYTSKSSVYGDHEGMWVDESAQLKATDDESKMLIEGEKIISSLKDLSWKVCILRLAQVYGPGREISDFYKSYYKKTIPDHGNFYTNFVHQQDVVGIVSYILEHQIEGIFNVVDNEHPTRQEIAELLSLKLNIPIPKYDPQLADFTDYNKRVSNFKIKEIGYTFKYPNRYY
jgi:nucleoside-diphosphate-sugar epimerase